MSNQIIYTKDSIFRLINENVSKRIDESLKTKENIRKKKQVNGLCKITVLGRINFERPDGTLLLNKPHSEWFTMANNFTEEGTCVVKTFDGKMYVIDENGDILDKNDNTTKTNINEGITRISGLALYESSKQKKAYKNKCYNVIQQYLGNASNLDLDGFYDYVRDENGKPIFDDNGKAKVKTNKQHIEEKFRKEFFHVNIPEELRKIEYIFLRIALKSGFYSFKQNKGELNKLKTICRYLAGCFINNKPLPFSLDEINESFRLVDLWNLVSPHIPTEKENKQIGDTNKVGRYEILKDIDFETAEEYGIYSNPESILCYTENQITWDEYTNYGENTAFLLLRDDWEEWNEESNSLPPYDDDDIDESVPYDDYGLSMIFLFVDPDGELVYSNTRWNHEHSENIVVDKAFTKEDIEKLIGQNFDEVFVPHEKDADDMFREILNSFEYCVDECGMDFEEAIDELRDEYSDYVYEINYNKILEIRDYGCFIIKIFNKANIWRSDKRCFISDIWFDDVRITFGDYIVVEKRGKYNLIHKNTGELMFSLPVDEWFQNFQHEISGVLPMIAKNSIIYIDKHGNCYNKKEIGDVCIDRFKNGDKKVLGIFGTFFNGFIEVGLFSKLNFITEDTGEIVWDKPFDEWFDQIVKYRDTGYLLWVKIKDTEYFFNVYERRLISFEELADYLKTHTDTITDKVTKTDSNGNKLVAVRFYGKYNFIIGDSGQFLFDLPFLEWPKETRHYSLDVKDYIVVKFNEPRYICIIDFKGNIYDPKTFNPEEAQKNSGI